jgi:hypothetical protein
VLAGVLFLDDSLLVDQLLILTWSSPSECQGHYFRWLHQELNPER